MSVLARAVAVRGSGRFQSCGTEIGVASAGYAGAVAVPVSFSATAKRWSGRRQDVLLLAEEGGRQPLAFRGRDGVSAVTNLRSGHVAGRMEGDLSLAGLESPRQPAGESGRAGGTY